MLKNNKINIYGCLLKLIYTPVFATKNLLITGGFFISTHLYQSNRFTIFETIYFYLYTGGYNIVS